MAGLNRRLTVAVIVSTAVCASLTFAGNKKVKQAAAGKMDERQQAIHLLNRLTFGPRPGDVDRVMSMGIDKWVDQQLHPDKIDDSSLQARLVGFRTLNMDAKTLVDNYPTPQMVKAVMNGRAPMPSDPVKRAIYQAQIDRVEQREAKQQAKVEQASEKVAADGTANQMQAGDSMQQEDHKKEARMYADLQFNQLMNEPANQRMQAILKMQPQDREDLVKSLRPAEREQLIESLTPEQRETLLALQNPERVIVTELQQAKILRSAYSERQVEEVMTDFWFNHFNVFINKGADRYLTTEYEQDVIRPHALGKFKDLLVATAKSPAMLFYLDNWDSVGPDSEFARYGGHRQPQVRPMRPYYAGPFGMPRMPRPVPNYPRPNPNPQKAQQRVPKGLNENYARELMELHTLGVDGGYTQQDVIQVAKAFTGWTIKEPGRGGEFEFDESKHEPGKKLVLGHVIKENGEKEGMEVLDILAHNPATARFVCTKLATRFVSDDPPKPLVDRMAETFQKSDGDIREVLKTMLKSPEFWSPNLYRAKVKTPLEFIASAIRASGADVDNAMPLLNALNRMGMPLYEQQPPTGYPMKADAWVNSSALLNRMNFSLQLASGRMNGVNFEPQNLLGLGPTTETDAEQVLAALENSLLQGDVSRQTHDTILKQMNDPQVTGRVLDDKPRPPNAGILAGLILGSPEFQKR
ncbi:MAG TPA: DUF1800 domain-containing protein [Terriglobales bacterium]|nr:DUF1800 domain-containing protein [Terriglobales bacterium]